VTRYAADSRDRVRDAVDMVVLVSARTELRRAGVNSYFGLCPFHDERTGSFHVSPDEKLYHCFGCQAAGDPFDFVMETEGVDFKGALEVLADRFGVQLETEAEDPAAATRRQRRERLLALLGRAAGYYARYLWDASEAASARSYLLGRGLSEETLRAFGVGYAPSAWDRILRASRSAGFSEDELLAVGLVQRSKNRPGQVYDRFRERIIFPSRDARGRVLGFGARAMRENQPPKYLNTSENDIYHKGSQLFGIDLARSQAARAGRVVLVEGYTDVLALHQAGLRNAVGIMGTALTEEQVASLEKIARVLELCLDADRAGQEAMLRAARVAAGRKLELRVVALPPGLDPAEVVERDGAETLRERVEGSVPFAVFHVERILDGAEPSAEGADRAVSELTPVFAELLPPSKLRDDLLRRVSGRLGLSDGQLRSLLEAAGERAKAGTVAASESGAGTGPAQVIDQHYRAERLFLVLCIAVPDAGRRVLAALDPDELLRHEHLRRAARHLNLAGTDSPLARLPVDDDELARLISDLVERAGRMPDVSEARLEHARLFLERERLSRALARARATGQPSGELARQRERVLAELRAAVAALEKAV
jgi:DNA primase